MSRRSATTLSIEVRLRVPPGSNMKEVLAFVARALQENKSRVSATEPLGGIDTDSMIVKLLRKETVYL